LRSSAASRQNAAQTPKRLTRAAGPFFIKNKGKDRGTFVRIGSNSLPASPEKVAELERARRMGAWDQEPMPGLARKDLDRPAIKRWLDAVGERSTDAKLRGLGVLAEYAGQLLPTRAGIILFGREQAIHFPDAQIRCVQFRGADKSRPVVKSEDRDDTVLDGIEAAIRFMERNTDRIVRITARTQREELDLYPRPAVREVLNNAVAHADYAVEGASIFVALYSDRLEISSPGTWPPGFSREDFESGVSLRRNKAISRVPHRPAFTAANEHSATLCHTLPITATLCRHVVTNVHGPSGIDPPLTIFSAPLDTAMSACRQASRVAMNANQ
jgi:ATP-dependent DNA helicase RecG